MGGWWWDGELSPGIKHLENILTSVNTHICPVISSLCKSGVRFPNLVILVDYQVVHWTLIRGCFCCNVSKRTSMFQMVHHVSAQFDSVACFKFIPSHIFM